MKIKATAAALIASAALVIGALPASALSGSIAGSNGKVKATNDYLHHWVMESDYVSGSECVANATSNANVLWTVPDCNGPGVQTGSTPIQSSVTFKYCQGLYFFGWTPKSCSPTLTLLG